MTRYPLYRVVHLRVGLYPNLFCTQVAAAEWVQKQLTHWQSVGISCRPTDYAIVPEV